MTTPAWIGLGSNLGDRRAILEAALAALAGAPGVAVLAVSSARETSPVGGPPGQGPFLNAAAHLETTLGPHQLLGLLQEVEARAGRVREVRWGERTLDLDLLIFGNQALDTETLKLPHPRFALRRFVLAPLAEIAPTVVDPTTYRTMADLLANLDRKPRRLAIDGPECRRKMTLFRRLLEALPGPGISEADPGSSDPDRPAGPSPARSDLPGREADAPRQPWIVTDFVYEPGLPGAEAAESSNPTFVLSLPGASGGGRIPGLPTPPRLRPESDDPDAIVAEVLATCRGIEGI